MKNNKPTITLGPKSKKQEMFLNTEADVCVFGGGAGCGKSYLGIMDMLKHINDPNFRGVVVRKKTPQIVGPGGVWQTAVTMYGDVFGMNALKIRKRDGEIEFPSGAQIKFRHCQYPEDKYNFQG